jgi:pimeloyl-ACP methyl ester carboxylesterase
MSDVEPAEFDFLPDDAAAVGRTAPLPPVQRVQLTPAVSALHWGVGPAQLLLLHGVALNAHTWDAAVLAWPESSPGFLALDLPGHGESPWRADADYSPVTLAEEVRQAVEAAQQAGLLVARPVLVGHSLGGLVAFEMIDTAAVPLAQLILIDILPLPPEAARSVADFLDGPSSFESREEIVQRALAFGLGGAKDALERAVFHNTGLTFDGRVAWKHHFGVLGGAGLHLSDAQRLWPIIEASRVPIDLVAGTLSFINPTLLAQFEAARPQARTVQLAGGHNLQEDNPKGLAEVLVQLTESATS